MLYGSFTVLKYCTYTRRVESRNRRNGFRRFWPKEQIHNNYAFGYSKRRFLLTFPPHASHHDVPKNIIPAATIKL